MKEPKLIRVDPSPTATVASSSSIVKAKPRKKGDPFTPKIIWPHSECSKKFWSWKALFGHIATLRDSRASLGNPRRGWRRGF